MIFSYIRPDKHFSGAFDQLKLINAYVEQKELHVDEEMIDQTSQNNRLSERNEAVSYFRAHEDDTLLIYDLWVLSSNIDAFVEEFGELGADLTVNADEVDSRSSGLHDLVSDRGRLPAMREVALRLSREHYNWATQAQRLVELYSNLQNG